MAVTDFADLTDRSYRASLTNSTHRENDTIPSGNEWLVWNPMLVDDLSRSGWPWNIAGPSTAASWSYSTHPEYSIPHPVAASGSIYTGAVHLPDLQTNTLGALNGLMVDIVGVQGGLAMNSTASQTTNLPTATLPTRVTGGDGVWMGLQIYASGGSTDTTFTVTYTNQAATGGRTSTFAAVSTPVNGDFYMMPLQAGDTGVRSVESVQLSASTGTAGNFGVILFKPLFITMPAVGIQDFTHIPGWNTPIDDEAVLTWLPYYYGGVSSQTQTTTFSFFEA